LRPLAAPRGPGLPRAATRGPCGHWRPLAATCGHLRPLAATWVAAFLKFKYRANCNLAFFPASPTDVHLVQKLVFVWILVWVQGFFHHHVWLQERNLTYQSLQSLLPKMNFPKMPRNSWIDLIESKDGTSTSQLSTWQNHGSKQASHVLFRCKLMMGW